MWPHIWQMACTLDDIPRIDDFIEYEIADRSVIVVRTAGGVNAFLNRCTHRGVRIVTGDGNCRDGLSCPFHGWQWSSDGKNTFHLKHHLINQKDRALSSLDLIPCRSQVNGSFVFINMDAAAPRLDEVVGRDVLLEYASRTERLSLLGQMSAELAVDWRSAILAVACRRVETDPVEEQAMRACLDFLGDGPSRSEGMEGWLTLPNFAMIAMPSALLAVRARPVDERHCLVEMWKYGRS